MASLQTAQSKSDKKKDTPPVSVNTIDRDSGNTQNLNVSTYLHSNGAQNNRAEYGVLEDTLEDIPLSVDFTGIYLVKKLHHDKGVEDDGVMLRRRGVERGVTAAVNVKDLLTCKKEKRGDSCDRVSSEIVLRHYGEVGGPYQQRAE